MPTSFCRESCYTCPDVATCPDFTSEVPAIDPNALAKRLAKFSPRQLIGRAAMLPETKNGPSPLTQGAESASKTA